MATDWMNQPITPATGIMGAPIVPPIGTPPVATTLPTAPAAQLGTPGTIGAGTVSAPSASSASYNPSMVQAEPKSTVSGQISDIIKQDSPLMQTARTGAMQYANARGLMNSSIGAQAGEQAVINAALPIAQQDAQTNFTAAGTNAAATNVASQFGAASQADTSRFNAAQGLSASTSNAQIATQVATQNVQNALQSGIINQAQANEMAKFNATQSNAMSQFNAGSQLDMAKANISAALQAGVINREQADKMVQFNVQQQNTLLSQQLDQTFKTELAASDAATKTQLQQMQGTTQQTLANIQADYQTLMQASSSAASIYSNSIGAIAEIVRDTNMDATAKAAAINGLVGRMKVAMNTIGSINGVALSGTNVDGTTYDLLDFGIVA